MQRTRLFSGILLEKKARGTIFPSSFSCSSAAPVWVSEASENNMRGLFWSSNDRVAALANADFVSSKALVWESSNFKTVWFVFFGPPDISLRGAKISARFFIKEC